MIKITKKILSLTLSVVMVISLLAGLEISSFAENGVLNYLTYEINDGEVMITGCNELISGNVVIPDLIDGYPVTIIGAKAFFRCGKLPSIIIPDSVTTIGDEAFSHCRNLISITIPDSVTTIGNGAFLACDSLISITVDEINEYFSNDEYGVLFNKEKTELIQYPIGKRRTEYTIPDSTTMIGYAAFCGCRNLESVTIPDGVTIIGDGAFASCVSLRNITIPDSVTSIGDDAFASCVSLGNITIPDSVTSIGDDAFNNCVSLTSITIPDSVTTIGDGAFANCVHLRNITIPDSVTTIGNGAFLACDSLTSITIPDSVTSIGDFAFGRYGDINDGFTIYGYTDTEAEAYAKRYNINFVSLDVVEEEELIVTDETIRVDTENGFATIPTGMTAEEIADMIENKNFTIVDKDGNEFDANALIGTGAKIQIISDDGSINEYTVVVSADIDGNGKTTAADARLALRAAAKIDSVDGVYSIAADANGDGKINAMDARIILRKAAGLE